MKQIGQGSHLLQALLRQVERLRKYPWHRFADGSDRFPQPSQVQSDRQQILSGRVVQFAREGAAFLILYLNEPGAQARQILLRTLDLGNVLVRDDDARAAGAARPRDAELEPSQAIGTLTWILHAVLGTTSINDVAQSLRSAGRIRRRRGAALTNGQVIHPKPAARASQPSRSREGFPGLIDRDNGAVTVEHGDVG